MKLHISSVLLVGLLAIGCSGTIQMSGLGMRGQGNSGPNYQVQETYQQSKSEVFGTVQSVIEEQSKKKLQSWNMNSTNESEGTIETDWMTTGTSGSVGGGRTMGAGSEVNDRMKLNVKVSEDSTGTKLQMRLTNQHKFTGNPNTPSEWKKMDVKQKDVEKYLIPLKEKIDKKLNS